MFYSKTTYVFSYYRTKEAYAYGKRDLYIWQKRPKRTNGAFKPSTHPLPGGAANLDVLAPKKPVRGSVTVTHSIVREHIL